MSTAAINEARPKRADRRRTLVTPEGIALPVTLASRGSRVGALLLDLFIIVLSFIAVLIVLSFSGIGLLSALGEGKDKAAPTTPCNSS